MDLEKDAQCNHSHSYDVRADGMIRQVGRLFLKKAYGWLFLAVIEKAKD
jgi:hypothetical protein